MLVTDIVQRFETCVLWGCWVVFVLVLIGTKSLSLVLTDQSLALSGKALILGVEALALGAET